MSTTLLELTRAAHERVERLERVASKHLRPQPQSQTERLRQSHQVRSAINQITDTTRWLVEIYRDEDRARHDEIAALAGNSTSPFIEFYDRLKEIREQHRHGAGCHIDDEEIIIDDWQLEAMFSGEEVLGRYLDLHEMHNVYINLPDAEKVEYSAYLGQLQAQPTSAQHMDYLRKLVDYLVGFLERTQPLLNLGNVLDRKIRLEAKAGKLCEMLHEVIARTKERADRKRVWTQDEMAREKEEDEDEDIVSEEDEPTGSVYNPKRLPVGWDGRPIPYWLYKLHGLGHELRCEICGDHMYRGRRAYERHFREARHRAGMRSLGIPNSKDLYEVTSIKEAKRLWDGLEERRARKRWHPDVEEELEDEEGNVYSGRTYIDLKRQGLI